MALQDAQPNLSTAQERMKRVVDKKRRTEDYIVSDVCGSADFRIAARYNLRRRIRSRQLNSSELDVTPMYLAITMTMSRSGGVETRHKRTLTNSTETPFTTCTEWGTNELCRKSVQLRSLFSVLKTGMYKPRSYHPGHPLLITLSTRIKVQ